MKFQKIHDQKGIAHIGVAVIAVLVVSAIGLVGWRLANKSEGQTSNQSTSDQTDAASSKHITSNISSKSTIQPNTQGSTATAGSSGASAAKPKTSSAGAPANSSAASSSQGNYSNLGSVSAASLYNVKSPPPSSQQPAMTIYACIKNLGGNTAYVQAYGVLSYPAAQGSAAAWNVSLSLSSSPANENIISSKSGQYTYATNGWQNSGGPSGTVNRSNVITTANFNPGVISDFYVWASGSYGGAVWGYINNHPNVTQLAQC
jgi:hypothetical protein